MDKSVEGVGERRNTSKFEGALSNYSKALAQQVVKMAAKNEVARSVRATKEVTRRGAASDF